MSWHSLSEDPPRLTEQTIGHHFVLYSAKRGSATCVVENDIADKVRRLTNSGWTHWDWLQLPHVDSPLDAAIKAMLASNAERAVVARNFYEMVKAAALAEQKDEKQPSEPIVRVIHERIVEAKGPSRAEAEASVPVCSCGTSAFTLFRLVTQNHYQIQCIRCDASFFNSTDKGWVASPWKVPEDAP